MDNEFVVCEEAVKYGNVILEKSFKFSVRIIKCYKELTERDSSLVPLYKQFLRSGTSIGANISEAQNSPSKKDFIHRLTIALKETRETEYWLKLLKEVNIISKTEFKSINNDCTELIKLLTSIIKKSKLNN